MKTSRPFHPRLAVRPRTLLIGTIVLIGLLAWSGPSSGVAQGAEGPRKWALLIGVEKYHRASQLRYTVNDVQRLGDLLRRRGDYRDDDILEITDTALNPRHQPLRASIMAELPQFLAKPGSGDHILVYFSGHGFRDKDGKLYLAPIDCDPANPAPTGIAVEWFREQLAACKAKIKLLVLDACHAGSEKGEDDDSGIAAKDLGASFRDMEGVITLASSTSDQKSLIWEEKQQSLFSYWFNQGLQGNADTDGDGAVTIDELYNYVHRNVTRTAKARFPREQTPVRIVRTGVDGVPEIIRLKPQTLKELLADMAEQVAWSMEERKLAKIGVLEFTNDTKLGELLGADFGVLGRYCAEELERRLMDLGGDKFSVVDRRRLQTALKSQQFNLDNLGSAVAMKSLSDEAGGMPAVALGTLRNRTGRVVTLQCKVLQTERDDLAGVAGGTALLNESEWAMLGRSVEVRPEDYRVTALGPGVSSEGGKDQLIERLDYRSQGGHPMLNPDFPYRVKIMVRDRASGRMVEARSAFRGNQMFVGLRQGDVYEIWVENRSGRMVNLRLLVDGLNTQPERLRGKMMVVEEAAPVARPNAEDDWVVGARVNLDEARYWILDPKTSNLFAIRGFFSKLTGEGNYREFRVVDAQKSLAARQSFTDQIGLITAAFYAPKSTSRAPVGTELGDQRTDKVELMEGTACGPLVAVVNIRYVEPETLESPR